MFSLSKAGSSRAGAALLCTCLILASPIRAQRADWESESKITDPTQECTPYSYPQTAGLTTGGQFPTIWQTAEIPAADTEAKALYDALAPSIPNIAPRGTRTGNMTGVNYDTASDPACWWTQSKCTTPKAKGVAADVVRCPEPQTWGLTFDDGPNCSHNAFYDYLRTQNQKATLFYIGSNVLDWPLEAQRGLADGHEICAHTWSHPYMTSMTNEEAFAELYYSKKAIKDVLGLTVECWRAPFGDVDDRIRYIGQALGMQSILWDHDTDDFFLSTGNKGLVEGNYNSYIDLAKNGSLSTAGTIVLTHELNNLTMSEFINFYPQIKAAYKQIVPVGTCLNNTKPYVEQNYVYPDFADYVAGSRASLPSPTAGTFSLPLPLSTGASSGSITPSLSFTAGGTPAAAASASSPSHTGTASSVMNRSAFATMAMALVASAAGALLLRAA